MKQVRKDLNQHEVRIADDETHVKDLQTDRARVLAGTWVANGLTCFFVAIIMWMSVRLAASEAADFRAAIINEVRGTAAPRK